MNLISISEHRTHFRHWGQKCALGSCSEVFVKFKALQSKYIRPTLIRHWVQSRDRIMEESPCPDLIRILITLSITQTDNSWLCQYISNYRTPAKQSSRECCSKLIAVQFCDMSIGPLCSRGLKIRRPLLKVSSS